MTTRQVSATTKARELLEYIRDYTAINDGDMPSFEEMRIAMGTASKSVVHRRLQQLEERGHIERMKWRPRAIRLVGDPCTVTVRFTAAEYARIVDAAAAHGWNVEKYLHQCAMSVAVGH